MKPTPLFLHRLADDIQSGDPKARDAAAMVLRRMADDDAQSKPFDPAALRKRARIAATMSVSITSMDRHVLAESGSTYEIVVSDAEWLEMLHIGPMDAAGKAGHCLHSLIRDTPQAQIIHSFTAELEKALK